MKLIRTGMLVACGVALFACGKNERASDTTTSSAASRDRSAGAYDTSAGMTTTTSGAMGDSSMQPAPQLAPILYEHASARIAGVRCEHEVTCDQVGPNKRYATRDDCSREEARRTRDQLTASECPNGVDGSKLQSCLQAITQKDCSDLVFSLQSVDACRSTNLCGAAPLR
jgi:hypothetical protein